MRFWKTKTEEHVCQFTAWSNPFDSTLTRLTASGDVLKTLMVKQESVCPICNLVDVRHVREGKTSESSPLPEGE